jgi:DNA (cytosine-5)-methyltransferase 1
MVKGKMKLVFAEIMRELKASGYVVSARLMNAMYFNVPQSRQRMIFIGVREDLGVGSSHPKGMNQTITCREAIGDSPNIYDRELPEFLKRYARIHPRGWNTDFPRYQKIKGNSAGAISLKWAQWDAPIGTLPRQEISCTGIVHPDRKRYLNLIEAALLTSYPPDFKFTDRKWGWERIGNSVPPLFMRAIAEHIRENILNSAPMSYEMTAD